MWGTTGLNRREVFELMATDSFPRFLKSRYYLDYATAKMQL